MAQAQRRRMKKPVQAPADCYFCTEKKEPMYSDVSVMQRFITDRGKIMSRSRNGLCTTHQRRLSESIKHARYLALLPFLIRD